MIAPRVNAGMDYQSLKRGPLTLERIGLVIPPSRRRALFCQPLELRLGQVCGDLFELGLDAGAFSRDGRPTRGRSTNVVFARIGLLTVFFFMVATVRFQYDVDYGFRHLVLQGQNARRKWIVDLGWRGLQPHT
jgi:hypothetical protein